MNNYKSEPKNSKTKDINCVVILMRYAKTKYYSLPFNRLIALTM